MPNSLSWPHQRRSGNGNGFWRWIFNAKKEEQKVVTEFSAIFSTPEKNKVVKQNLYLYQQRQPSNAESLAKHETATGLNLNISQPNNYKLNGGT